MLVKPAGNGSVTKTLVAASEPALRGCKVNVAAVPAIIGVGNASLVMLRSAPASTATCAVVVLLLEPSPIVALNVAEFVIVPLIEFCTRATSDSTSLPPLASEPLRLQVTV